MLCRLAVFPNLVEEFDDMSVILRRLVAQVPTLETRMVTISLDDFVNKRLVEIDLLPPRSSPPIETRVVSAEIEADAELIGEGQENLGEVLVHRKQVGNALRLKDALVLVPGPNDDDRVDADLGVELKFATPLLRSPILRWDIVRDLIKKGTGNTGQGWHPN